MKTPSPLSPKTPTRRYQTQMTVSLVMYVALLSACVELLKGDVAGPWRIVLALLPMLSLVWGAAAFILWRRYK
jgi:hypothetical protein